MKLFKLTLAVAMAAFFIAGATAQAQDTFQSNAATGDWDVTATWQIWVDPSWVAPGAGDYPVAGDTANIRSGHTVTVSGEQAAAVVDIADSGTAILNMASGDILKVSSSLTVNGSGVFQFNSSSGTRPIVRADNAVCELDGTFTMLGTDGGLFDDDSGSFEVANGDTATFDGTYLATISAPIEVDGIIKADDASVTLTGDIAAGSAGRFWVNSGTMTLAAAVTITAGADFYVTGGAMNFSEIVETDGGFKQTGGTVTVNQAKRFTATGVF